MANRFRTSAVTRSEFPRRNSCRLTDSPACANVTRLIRRVAHPSGILSAAVFNRGASVSSGFPSWGTLDGSRPLPAKSLWPRRHR
jgi:hypothetical protein